MNLSVLYPPPQPVAVDKQLKCFATLVSPRKTWHHDVFVKVLETMPASAFEVTGVISLPRLVLIFSHIAHFPVVIPTPHPQYALTQPSTLLPGGYLATPQSSLLGLVSHSSQMHSSVSNWHSPFPRNFSIILYRCQTHQQAGIYRSRDTQHFKSQSLWQFSVCTCLERTNNPIYLMEQL